MKNNKQLLFDGLKEGNLRGWNLILETVGTKKMIELTKGIDEHPEDYEGPCYCDLCLSYGD